MKKEILLKEQEQLYTELSATFTEKEQFRLLNELLETEVELERDRVAFRWEITEAEFKELLADSDRGIKDVDRWWVEHGDKVVHCLRKGVDATWEAYDLGQLINDAIASVWEEGQ